MGILDFLFGSAAWQTKGLLMEVATQGAVDASEEKKVKPVIIGPTAAILGGIAAAPFIYKAYSSRLRGKRAKKASEHVDLLENASNRAVTLVAALLPAVGLPLAYLSVQELESRGVISKGLGDAVQGLIAAGAVAPAIGGIASLAAKVK